MDVGIATRSGTLSTAVIYRYLAILTAYQTRLTGFRLYNDRPN